MAAAGLGDGTYELVGQEVFVKDGSRAAGERHDRRQHRHPQSMRAQYGGVRGVALPDAIKMASLNPARVLGLEDREGLLAPGRQATLTVLDQLSTS
jgi:N-acetylglucosamine-6-phosphate deacetylase